MLKAISLSQFDSPCVLLLGGFDGLHRGHRMLVEEAKKYALPVGVMSLSGGKGEELFLSEERSLVYGEEGIDFFFPMTFSDELKNTSPEDFLRSILSRFHAQRVVCGEDFRFGKDAMGTPELIEKFVSVTVLPLEEENGEKIATNGVKKLVREGEIESANALLATPYFIGGVVEHGRKVGRTIGFPTLNVRAQRGKVLPKEGVYGGFVCTQKGTFPSIINFGARPTFDVEEYMVEAYLDGFDGDLYGTEVEIFPTAFYRAIKRFESVDALKNQLKEDVLRLRAEKGGKI